MSISPFENLSLQLEMESIQFRIILENSFWNTLTSYDTERHNHSTYEFHLIAEGKGYFQVDNDRAAISAGSIYIIKPGIFHFYKAEQGNPIKQLCFKFEYKVNKTSKNNEHLDEADIISSMLSRNYSFINYSGIDPINLESLINEIQNEIMHKNLLYYSKVQHLFGQILITVFRGIHALNRTTYKASTVKLQEERISIIEDFFDHCYNFEVTHKELCSKLYISLSQLNRILKKLYNKSFKQKLMEVRIEYIKYLLEGTDLPLIDIAERAGYSSEGNFSAAFKRITGLSPSHYRKILTLHKITDLPAQSDTTADAGAYAGADVEAGADTGADAGADV